VYLRGGAGAGARAPWLQLAHVAWVSLQPLVRRELGLASERLYALRAWAAFCVLAPFGWLSAVLMPSRKLTWAVSRAFARAFFRLAGVSFSITGTEHLARASPCIAVANHSSYLDGMLLVASLPRAIGFIAKRELLSSFIARRLLRSLGTFFVERFDVERSVLDAGELARIALAGESLLFFPEGTFNRASGVLPFRMGAFQVAAEAGLPVVPVTITGTRSMLRDGSWFPRRARLSVTISAPIACEGRDWAAALRLRDAARAEVLRSSGEPDLSR
jgi:1-acyl-sn-glycerol-3-phosphate acyltransferase